MMARARRDVPDEVRAEIVRQWHRGKGRRRIARSTRQSERLVRGVLVREGLSHGRQRPWHIEAPRHLRPDDWRGPYTHDDHLRMHAGERAPLRLGRDLGRTPDSIRARLSVHELRLTELRLELTLVVCGQLIGRDPSTLEAWIRRGELRARRVDGAWRVWPKTLRELVLGDKSRVDWSRVTLRHELIGLLAEEWGVSDDTERKAKSRARKAGGDGQED